MHSVRFFALSIDQRRPQNIFSDNVFDNDTGFSWLIILISVAFSFSTYDSDSFRVI